MSFKDDNIFFHGSLPQDFINNTIFVNAYHVFPPVRAPFIFSSRYFENQITTPDYLLELEQPKIEQLALTIAVLFKNDL